MRYSYDFTTGDRTEHPDIVPVIQPPITPRVVLMHRARLALLGAGLLPAVGAAIDALPAGQRAEALVYWEYSPTLERDHPLVGALASGLGLDDSALDALFAAADAL